MKRLSLVSIALLAGSVAQATDLNLTARSGGTSTIVVAPGATVNYEVVADLSDNANEGLAYFRFDANFSGGPLTKAAEPNTSPMLNFVAPAGFSNPAGLGGTVSGGNLLQIGGAQNTINNVFASAPIGTVITGLAKPGNSLIVVKGTLTAPIYTGSYTLALTNVDANVIKQGETGFPFWACEKTTNNTVTNLTVKVSALTANVATVSASAPSPVALALNGGLPWANRPYVLLGSVRGTSPGVSLGPNVTLPLNPDAYLNFLVANPTNVLLTGNVGSTNALGLANAAFQLPVGASPAAVGLKISHAWLTTARDFASDAATVQIVP
ncbi:MAG: hypothetical protein JNL94_11585 [Planctomycetes bacterium]|nr:hypothetical protein [Planctomycetota bacterium]